MKLGERSAKGKLNFRDMINSLVMAFGTGALVAAGTMLDKGGLPDTWPEFKVIMIGGVSAMVAYLGKNIFAKK